MIKSFKRNSRTCLGAILLILLLTSAIQTEARPDLGRKNCLWKVSSKHNTVYLLGSIHFMRDDAYPLSASMEAAYRNAQKIVLEINLDDASSVEAQLMMASKGVYPDGQSLRQSVSPKTFELVKEKVEELGLNIQQVDRLKPWLVMISLAALQIEQLGYDPKLGIDKHFFDQARKDGKEVLSLESIEYQIKLMEEMSAGNQEAALLETIQELDLFKKEFEDILKAWTSGETQRLQELLLESFKGYPELLDQLLLQRNRNWLPKVEEFLNRQDNVLVIVGAAHLIGDRGLVELLRQKGYLVEQL